MNTDECSQWLDSVEYREETRRMAEKQKKQAILRL